MALGERLFKPHYVFRPAQVVRRALSQVGGRREPVIKAAWGGRLLVARQEQVGAGLTRMGVHELAVSEVMWRLTEPGDLALDVGANVGYFSGLLALRAGEVIAFEPNPHLVRFLEGNRRRWGPSGKKVHVDHRAVSDRCGTALLHLPAAFASNYGVATLATSGEDDLESIEVVTVALDEVVAGRPVGLLKIDVEGHELAALHGARETLARRLVRHIIFEEHLRLPSPVSVLLEDAGFTIFGIEEAFLGPRLTLPSWVRRGWDAPTYLATQQPQRARSLLRPRGWRVLYPRLSRLLGA